MENELQNKCMLYKIVPPAQNLASEEHWSMPTVWFIDEEHLGTKRCKFSSRHFKIVWKFKLEILHRSVIMVKLVSKYKDKQVTHW